MKKALVSIIMGSKSDLEVMSNAEKSLKKFGIPYELEIVSAHRTPEKMFEFAKGCEGRGIQVIIAGAGGAAHLPGMVASVSTLPVIGVPIHSKNSLQGLDSILSILQMPTGVPVATLALNGAENAGILAAEILALQDSKMRAALREYKSELQALVDKQNREL